MTSRLLDDVFADDLVCEELWVGGKKFPDDFVFGTGKNQVATAYATNSGSGSFTFTNLLSLGTGVSIVGGNLLLNAAQSLATIRVEEVVLSTHVDSFTVQILLNNSIITSYTYTGSGALNPRYGFKSQTISVGSLPSTISVNVINSTALSITVSATIYQLAASV